MFVAQDLVFVERVQEISCWFYLQKLAHEIKVTTDDIFWRMRGLTCALLYTAFALDTIHGLENDFFWRQHLYNIAMIWDIYKFLRTIAGISQNLCFLRWESQLREGLCPLTWKENFSANSLALLDDGEIKSELFKMVGTGRLFLLSIVFESFKYSLDLRLLLSTITWTACT